MRDVLGGGTDPADRLVVVLIVAGFLEVDPSRRNDYLATVAPATAQARATAGCLEFVQAPDPLSPGRIVIYERWETAEQLQAFRDLPAPPDAAPAPDILDADVRRYEIASVGPA